MSRISKSLVLLALLPVMPVVMAAVGAFGSLTFIFKSLRDVWAKK